MLQKKYYYLCPVLLLDGDSFLYIYTFRFKMGFFDVIIALASLPFSSMFQPAVVLLKEMKNTFL